MNKKGFTMIELLGVMALFGLVLLLVVPGLSKLSGSNTNREYETYLDMMKEYTKTFPNYKTKSYVCLKDLGLKNINETVDCKGYVRITNSGTTLTPYLSCTKNGKEIFKTETFSLPSDC